MSYEKNSNLKEYGKNRALRLFPALIVCGISTVLLTSQSWYFNTIEVPSADIILWFLANISFFQFWDPDFLQGYGIGQANGALWTIFIEIQFYILIPIIFYILKFFDESKHTLI